MPPKKKSKQSGSRHQKQLQLQTTPDPSQPSPSPTASIHPLALTENGIEQLRELSQHRPQRIALGGFQLGSAAASAAIPSPPPPAPVTLQIIQINRYFVDQRFWSLVGVPFPVLPTTSSTTNQTSNTNDQKNDAMDESGNGSGLGASGSKPASALTPSISNAPPSFDQYSDLHVAYDLIVSDGRFQLKVVLSPTLAVHLEKGGMLPNGIIQVLEACIRFDETVVAGPGFIVIKQINILAETTNAPIFSDPTVPLAYPDWVTPSERLNKPVVGGPRSYYLSLFNEDTITFDRTNYPPEGEAERVHKEQQQLLARVEPIVLDEEEERKESEAAPAPARRGRPKIVRPVIQDSRLMEPQILLRRDVITISSLLKQGTAVGDKCIVGRIFAKSRILNFGRKSASPNADMLRAPFSFEIVVGDESNEQIKVILWNTLVGNYFDRIHLGQLVAIRGFRLKQARANNDFELSLNPYNPIGSIRVLDGDVQLEEGLIEKIPPLTMTISPISIIKGLPDDSFFDVAGIVTYASPMLREWSQQKKQFYQYRWILLADMSCVDALSIKVYTNSQESQLESVQATDVLYLSNLTVHTTNPVPPIDPALASGVNPNPPPPRSIVATSTNYTLLLNEAGQKQTGHATLIALLQWRDTVNHADLALYPPLFTWNHDFEQYRSLFTDVITPLYEVPTIQHSLRYQQQKNILIQGFMIDLIIHPAGLRPISDGIMNEEDYIGAMKRLFPDGIPTHQQIQVEESKAAEPTATVSSSKKTGRPNKHVTVAAADATTAMVDVAPDLSQSSIASRLRRSARQQSDELAASQESTTSSRRGRSRSRSQTPAPMDETTTTRATRRSKRGRSAVSAASTSRSPSTSRSRSRSQSQGRKPTKTTKGKKGRTRSSSVGRSTKRQDVREVPRKRKASRSASEARASTTAASSSSAIPSASPSAPAAISSLAARPPPSAPSVLATLILRDLNGENEVEVELHDPILPHANFDQAPGTISASCQTPIEAPRIFLGLSQLLPSSAFTSNEWTTLLETACSAEPEPSPKSRSKKKSQPPPPPSIHSAIRRLHDTLQREFLQRRLLATMCMTRLAYRLVETRLTTIFQANPQ